MTTNVDTWEAEVTDLKRELGAARQELATLHKALRRFKASTQGGPRAEYLAAQAALVALAKEGT